MSEWIASAFLLLGAFFCLVAGIGIIRLKDVFSRMHAATKAGTLGLGLICVAVMIKAETWLGIIEALFVFVFMLLTAPVGAHLIGRAAFRKHQQMDENTRQDEDAEAFRSAKH
ncbi:monovalent cation/H(+) antiporter subunit G [Amaricoccus macauensis]|uniref:monovalent cation/H(+) antiporter subunit G n=1 Tax=Amaricoccus macauensis TaxID=57001 RepID=UPI003C7B8F6E